MHIINAMFSRGLGGIEQSFVDYCEAIKGQDNKVTALIHPDAQVRELLVELGINIVNVKNFGQWDAFAKSYIKKILKQTQPDAIVAHGNRAIGLIKAPAKSLTIPVVGVTHNYNIKHLIGLDAIFATTEDLMGKVVEAKQNRDTVYKIPNMVRVPKDYKKSKPFNKTPVIGTMGRFVKKKGFDIFLRSMAELKEYEVDVKAVIGGSGEEEKNLKILSDFLKTNDNVEFKGWINNKSELFDNIDIFCLPSLHEPFGIILLEAFMNGKPVVTTDSEGPSEIATHEQDALIVEKGCSIALANSIKDLIKDESLANKLVKNAQDTVKKYDINVVGETINQSLLRVVVG